MSKSFNNFTDPNQLMDEYSADSLRFLLLSSPLLNGEDFSLQDKDVADISRKLNMIWNMYDFFTLYAEVDGWECNGELTDPTPELKNVLDQWIVSRAHQLSAEVDEHMQKYDLPNALKPVLPFIDDASNWYVRRSRRRFWKNDDKDDQQAAFTTLHYVLVQLSMILAPFTPFLAEELYRKLTGGESVHLLDWPEAGHINELIVDDMAELRDCITLALSKRAAAGIKTRQPLRQVTLTPSKAFAVEHQAAFKDITKEEVNVKGVLFDQNLNLPYENKVALDTKIDNELKAEGQMRELVRLVQSARKAAKLNVDDHIALELITDATELHKVIKTYAESIKQETLATELNKALPADFEQTTMLDGQELTIKLAKTTD
jgi:isoleucyl-tRNA synthetase